MANFNSVKTKIMFAPTINIWLFYTVLHFKIFTDMINM